MAIRIRWARHRILLAAILFVVGSSIHARALLNGFALDDYPNIVENTALRSFTTIFLALFEPSWPGNLFRPAQTFVNGILFAFTGLNPLPYHVVNILLHGIVTVLAFRLLNKVVTTRISFLAVLLWAAFPTHTEVVANANGITELLVGVFGLLTANFLANGRRSYASLVFFFLALCSKESAVVIVFVTALVQIYTWEFSLKKNLPLILTLLLYFTVRTALLGMNSILVAIDPLDNPIASDPWQSRIITALILLGKYAFTTIIPFELSADYSFNQLALWTDPTSSVSIACFMITAGMALLCFSRIREVRFGAQWFFLAFSITCNVFFPIGTVFAERLLYLPSLGIALALTAWLGRVGLSGFGIALVIAYSVVSFMQDTVWRNNYALHTYQMGISYRSAKTQHNYAVVLRNIGDLSEASLHARRALEIYPCYADAASTLGSIYLMRGIQNGAEHWFRKALLCNSQHAPTLNRLGRINFNRGEISLAKVKFSEVLSKDPDNIEATAGLLAVAIHYGSKEEATKLLRFLETVTPDSKEVEELRRSFLEKFSDAGQ